MAPHSNLIHHLLILLLLLVQVLTSSGFSSVRHVVMFSLKEEATKAQHEMIRAGLLELPSKIPEIQEYEIGTDLLLEGGQNHPAGKNRGFCWTACFQSQKDYEIYDASEAHKEFLGKLKPLVEPGSRAAIQFEKPN